MLSKTINIDLSSDVLRMESVVFSMYWRSGSIFSVRGVGTQIKMQSGSPRREKSSVTSKWPLLMIWEIREDGIDFK